MTFYTTDRGEKPVLQFIKAQQLSARTKIAHLMDLLKKHGHMLGVPHSKRLQHEIYELRVRGKEELRILYAFKGEAVILLHAFKKQTQKTPQKEISRLPRKNSLSPRRKTHNPAAIGKEIRAYFYY